MASERKRQKLEEPEQHYTQGPLDEDFGQHSAFPLDATVDSEDPVIQYLKSVRQEAQADKPFHFVERHDTAERTESDQHELVIPQEKVDEIMKALNALKKDKMEELQSDSETEQHYDVPESAAAWRKKVFTEQPDPSFLKFLEHTTIIKLIVYYTKWLLINMPEQLGLWIFTTFLRLDRDLDHRETAIVRDLGKKALKLREKLGTANDVAPAVEHIIDMTLSIVAVHFRQRDLLLKGPL